MPRIWYARHTFIHLTSPLPILTHQNVRLVDARLKEENARWVPAHVTKGEVVMEFLQVCVFPRCFFTASDAVYAARFAFKLHELRTK